MAAHWFDSSDSDSENMSDFNLDFPVETDQPSTSKAPTFVEVPYQQTDFVDSMKNKNTSRATNSTVAMQGGENLKRVECLEASDMTAIQEKLIEYEGIRFTAYDAQPKNAYVDWTICVGFNLKRDDARAVFKKVLPGVDFDSVYAGTKALTGAQCLALFKHDLTETYIPRAAEIVGKQWCKLPLNVKIALVNAVYRGDLAYSHKTAKLMREGNWCAVKAEYLNHEQYINCVKLGIPGICTRMDWNAEQFHTMCK